MLSIDFSYIYEFKKVFILIVNFFIPNKMNTDNEYLIDYYPSRVSSIDELIGDIDQITNLTNVIKRKPEYTLEEIKNIIENSNEENKNKIEKLELDYISREKKKKEKFDALVFHINNFLTKAADKDIDGKIDGNTINELLYDYLVKEGFPTKPVNFRKALIHIGLEYKRPGGSTVYKGYKLKPQVLDSYMKKKNKTFDFPLIPVSDPIHFTNQERTIQFSK